MLVLRHRPISQHVANALQLTRSVITSPSLRSDAHDIPVQPGALLDIHAECDAGISIWQGSHDTINVQVGIAHSSGTAQAAPPGPARRNHSCHTQRRTYATCRSTPHPHTRHQPRRHPSPIHLAHTQHHRLRPRALLRRHYCRAGRPCEASSHN